MSPMQLTLTEAAQALSGAQVMGDGALTMARVHTDTRTLRPGDLFVALRGERFDAAAFLSEAKAKGAVAALCEQRSRPQLLAAGLPGILVPDAKMALGELSRAWRQRFSGPLIAVTGSNGKTTVTQMVAAILRVWQGDAALATQGNLNNDIGLPLTLLRLRPGHRVAVVELGMNHRGEIGYLASIARPTVALVNNAQREHQEFMATVEAVARENGAVLSALDAQGVAVFPAGDVYHGLWARMAGESTQLLFGEAADGAVVTARDACWQGDHWRVQADSPAGTLEFSLHIAGRHNVRNALAAIACAVAVGAPPDAMVSGLSGFRPVPGRSRSMLLRHRGRVVTLVDDSYNANPDSVRAIIDVLAELPGPRLLVLGDMGEVGDQGPAFHAEIGHHARARGIDAVLTLGDLAAHTAKAFGPGRHCEGIDGLIELVKAGLEHCASIAVKGSRFMRMERVIEAVTAASQDAQEGAHAL